MTASLILQSILVSSQPLESLPGRAQPSFFAQYGKDIVDTVLSITSGVILTLIAPAVFRKIASLTNRIARRIGPERSMSREYCNNLAFEIRQIKLLGMTSPRNLEEVFVPLRIRDPDPKMGAHRRTTLYPGLTAAMSKHSRITMLGDPGAGKTTVARQVALLAAEGKIKPGGKSLLPFYIPLNEIKPRFEPVQRGKNEVTPEEILTMTMEAFGFEGAEKFISRRLRDGRCLVIFDGFDELADDSRQSIAASMIRRLARNYNMENRIIVTSREAGFRPNQFNAFTTLVVEDLPTEQAHSYILKWFANEPSTGKNLIRILEDNARLRSLASNPLMLAVICITYEARGNLPNRRTELYEYCIDTLNTLWDESREVDRSPAFTGPVKFTVLKHVAFEMHAERKVEFTKREFSAKVRRHLPDAGAKLYQEEDFVREVIEHTGIVRANGADTLAFQHLTFQEYLAARKLVDDEALGIDYLITIADDPWWSETIVLAAGIMRDATSLITRIYHKSLPDLTDQMCLLLGRCLTDADLTDLGLRDEILTRIVKLAIPGMDR
jgi:predicted NACHT family NTPase